MITQNEIQELQKLRKQITQLQARAERLRKKVLRKHNHYEDIEPGNLSVEVKLQRANAFSYKALLAGIGRTRLRELQSQIRPTEYQVINIVKSKAQRVPVEPAFSDFDSECDYDYDEEWD